METVFMTKLNFEEIQEELKAIKNHLNNVTSPAEHFITNDEFVKLMDISPRTAQIWRDEGIIGFSQKGKKIYYRMSDIDQFLSNYHKAPFANPEKSI